LSRRCVRSRCLNERLGFSATLVFGVAIPPERSNDEQNYDALHTIEVVNEGSNLDAQRRAARLAARPHWSIMLGPLWRFILE